MKRAYLAISYSNRRLFDKEVNRLVELSRVNNIDLISFVDKYNFNESQEKEMMDTAFNEIDNSDFLIAELTTKSIGVGIELGYARGKGKPVIYLRKKGSEYSTTAYGSADYHVEYENEKDLVHSMKGLLNQMVQKLTP